MIDRVTTSIIDYIFRELAISYLDRSELAHVAEEDLRADALHKEKGEPEFEDEEFIEERLIEAQEAAKREAAKAQMPRSGHLRPLGDSTNGSGHAAVGDSHVGNGNGGRSGGAAVVAKAAPKSASAEKIRIARLKGYEGDPCSECGQLTLTRNGACLKCDTCGATSGCS